MDTETALLWGFVVLLLIVIATIIGLLVHSGLFVPVVVKTCKPDLGEAQIAYKFARGPYKESGALFTEIHTLLPEYRTVGVYYDDPKVKQPQKLRYIVGVILAEGAGATVLPEHRQLLEEKGYQFATFPAIDHAVQTSFPFNSTISIIMAVMKVYPALREYIEARSLCARPFLEVYDSNRAQILFIGPLARQDDFYVPEVLQEEEEDTHQDDYDDDARSDNSSRSWDESASFMREEAGGGDGHESDLSECEESNTTTTTTTTATTTITTTAHPPPPLFQCPSPSSPSTVPVSHTPPPPPPLSSLSSSPSPPPLPSSPPSLPEDTTTTTTTTPRLTTTTTTTAAATPLLPPPIPDPVEPLDIADTGSAGSEESDANTASSFEEIDDREAAAAAAAATAAAAAATAAAGGGGESDGRDGSVRKDDDEGER